MPSPFSRRLAPCVTKQTAKVTKQCIVPDKGTMPPVGEKLKPEEIKMLVTDVVRKFAEEPGNQEPEKEKKEPEK